LSANYFPEKFKKKSAAALVGRLRLLWIVVWFCVRKNRPYTVDVGEDSPFVSEECAPSAVGTGNEEQPEAGYGCSTKN
jgi:hypothetical protein